MNITINRAVVEQALEALEYHVEQTRPIHRTSEAIDALRAALEQLKQEEAWAAWAAAKARWAAAEIGKEMDYE